MEESRRTASDAASGNASGDRRREDLLASYLDRLNRGEKIDRDRILAEQPDAGEALLADLEAFIELAADTAGDETLGTLGDYTLRRQIGRGGMGVVYEAWQSSLDRPVALKVLPAGIAADSRAFVRFMQEAKTAAQLSHPSVVGVYGMGVEQSTPYFAMELVEGETLAQILTRVKDAEPESETPFGRKDGAGYFESLALTFADVADGLQHAHSKKVIHRDIKPSNLILNSVGRLRILDFGLARLEGQESLTVSGDVVGTPQYMSPEQARRKQIPVDHRTDVYSLGATLYEALCGRPPFRGKDHQDTLSQIIAHDPPEPKRINLRVPKDLETIVLKCLRKDAADRYGTAEALGQDLRRFARGEAIEARPRTEWERWARRVVRSRGRIAAAAAVLALLVAAGFLTARDLRARRLKLEAEYEPRVMEAVMQVSARPLSKQWNEGLTFGVLPGDLEQARGTDYIAEAVRALESAAPLAPERPDADYHRARWLLLLEDDAGAEKALRSALARRPDFAPGRALLARILEKHRVPETSREELERAAGLGQSVWAEAWIAADRAVEERRWDEAEGAFARLVEVELSGQSPYAGSMMESLVGRGRARLELRKYTEAIEDFACAEHDWPRWPVPTLFKAKAYARRGDLDHAESLLKALWDRLERKDEIAFQAIQLFKHVGVVERSYRWADRLSTPYLRACFQAHLAVLDDQAEAARAAVHEAIRLNPGDIFARLTAGLLAFNFYKGRGSDLVFEEQCCREAVALDPKLGQAYAFLAGVLHAQGRVEAALVECERGIQAEPASPWAHESKGWALYDVGAFKDAVLALERAVEVDPRVPIPRIVLASALLEMSRHDEAINACKAALLITPGYAFAWRVQAQCLEKSDRFEEAAAAYRNAARGLLPGRSTSSAYNELVRLLVEQGQIREALAEARIALQVDPALNGLNLQLRRLLIDGKLHGLALELRAIVDVLEQALTNGKESPAILKTLAAAWHLGNPERDTGKALRFAALANERSSATDLEAPLILAEVQLASRLRIEAVRTLEEAVERKGSNAALLEKLAAYRQELLPDFASYASIDAEVTGAERARTALAELAPLTASEDMPRKLLYLEGRLLHLEGQFAEARERFERLAAQDPERPEPFLQAVACLRAAGDFAAAEARVRGRLAEVGRTDSKGLWELWAQITLLDQRRDPAELADAVPLPDEGAGADLSWLLGTLASQRPIRIDCGGEDLPAADGGRWSRDRFFTSGRRFREWKDEDGGAHVYPFEAEVQGTADPALYVMNRIFDPGGPVKAGYRIPLPPGSYRLRLHFAEIWFRGPGMRSFDVVVEGERVLPSYEPFQAGFATAKVETFDVQVDDALLEVELVHKIGNPFLSALEVESRE